MNHLHCMYRYVQCMVRLHNVYIITVFIILFLSLCMQELYIETHFIVHSDKKIQLNSGNSVFMGPYLLGGPVAALSLPFGKSALMNG